MKIKWIKLQFLSKKQVNHVYFVSSVYRKVSSSVTQGFILSMNVKLRDNWENKRVIKLYKYYKLLLKYS